MLKKWPSFLFTFDELGSGGMEASARVQKGSVRS